MQNWIFKPILQLREWCVSDFSCKNSPITNTRRIFDYDWSILDTTTTILQLYVYAIYTGFVPTLSRYIFDKRERERLL